MTRPVAPKKKESALGRWKRWWEAAGPSIMLSMRLDPSLVEASQAAYIAGFNAGRRAERKGKP